MEAATRSAVRRRARDACEYCLLPQTSAPFLTFHVEHITAIQHGGNDSPDNLALACPDCNRHKGPNLTSIDPFSGVLVRLFHPRIDRWEQHFSIMGPWIEATTDIGRATARLLRLNDPDRLLIREALIDIGEWPPQ